MGSSVWRTIYARQSIYSVDLSHGSITSWRLLEALTLVNIWIVVKRACSASNSIINLGWGARWRNCRVIDRCGNLRVIGLGQWLNTFSTCSVRICWIDTSVAQIIAVNNLVTCTVRHWCWDSSWAASPWPISTCFTELSITAWFSTWWTIYTLSWDSEDLCLQIADIRSALLIIHTVASLVIWALDTYITNFSFSMIASCLRLCWRCE